MERDRCLTKRSEIILCPRKLKKKKKRLFNSLLLWFLLKFKTRKKHNLFPTIDISLPIFFCHLISLSFTLRCSAAEMCLWKQIQNGGEAIQNYFWDLYCSSYKKSQCGLTVMKVVLQRVITVSLFWPKLFFIVCTANIVLIFYFTDLIFAFNF